MIMLQDDSEPYDGSNKLPCVSLLSHREKKNFAIYSSHLAVLQMKAKNAQSFPFFSYPFGVTFS